MKPPYLGTLSEKASAAPMRAKANASSTVSSGSSAMIDTVKRSVRRRMPSIFAPGSGCSTTSMPPASSPAIARVLQRGDGCLDELSSLLPDLIERGPELRPSFVNLVELSPRFARSERDEEAAAQAGHLRMIAKPTDGLLVCLAAARAGNLDLGIIERAFGHDASLSEKLRRIA